MDGDVSQNRGIEPREGYGSTLSDGRAYSKRAERWRSLLQRWRVTRDGSANCRLSGRPMQAQTDEPDEEVCMDFNPPEGSPWTHSTVDYSISIRFTTTPSNASGTMESPLSPTLDRCNNESRPDETMVPTAPPESHLAVDVTMHGKTLSGLVDTCVGVGITASNHIHDLELKTIPTMELIHAFEDASPRPRRGRTTAPLQYGEKTYWETLSVPKRFHSNIHQYPILLKSGILQFANPTRFAIFIIKKLKDIMPLAACKSRRTHKTIRAWFTGQSSSEDVNRKEEERNRRALESNEQRRQEEAEELLERMSNGAAKHRFRLEETRKRRAWQDSFDAGG